MIRMFITKILKEELKIDLGSNWLSAYREVSLHDITYKVYYLVLREGTGVSPCNVDGVLASYKVII
jgi:hypothetical protein